MTDNTSVAWTLSSATDWTHTHRHGTAPSRAAAWLAALAAARAALLAGDLDDVALAVDDALPTAQYFPARDDDAGALDPFEVTADLVEIYQGETSAHVAAAITSPPPPDAEPTGPREPTTHR